MERCLLSCSVPRDTVLVVEDDDDLRRMFRTALSFAGFDVQEAGDGYTALKSIDRHRPTAIVLDLGLPNVSGYVVLQDLMAQAHTRDIPVIVVTGQSRAEQPEGAACLLRKPVTPDRLINTVRGCILAGGAGVDR
jgi:DNA-binding response OmpR family regulator